MGAERDGLKGSNQLAWHCDVEHRPGTCPKHSLALLFLNRHCYLSSNLNHQLQHPESLCRRKQSNVPVPRV
uniref:Uncharacterized protein n=1 Tax=Tetraselmis sp. GSL018 TaxID=582737 RepID=A0A061QK73_9CHLO